MELQELLLNLRDVTPTHTGPYTYQHEYDDFRVVFGGPAGARVLSMISDICTPDPVIPGMTDDGLLWFNEGLRWTFSQILVRLSGSRVTEAEKPEPDYDPRDNL